MERLWSPAVATRGNRWQIRARRKRPTGVHGSKLGRVEGVEKLDRVFASVAGEVAVVAVDHGQAASGAHCCAPPTSAD
jgi:hypothetical protein